MEATREFRSCLGKHLRDAARKLARAATGAKAAVVGQFAVMPHPGSEGCPRFPTRRTTAN